MQPLIFFLTLRTVKSAVVCFLYDLKFSEPRLRAGGRERCAERTRNNALPQRKRALPARSARDDFSSSGRDFRDNVSRLVWLLEQCQSGIT